MTTETDGSGIDSSACEVGITGRKRSHAPLYGSSVRPRLPRLLRRLIAELIISDRERDEPGFPHVTFWPPRISGFEDLAFLFSSTILAHGIVSMRLDEAAYLYRLVRETAPRAAVEIGRFRGGSTFLIAAALERGTLHSYDVEIRQGLSGQTLDRQLVAALERYGLADRVHLHVADSGIAQPPEPPIDFLFVDGDHSEQGVQADFDRWASRLTVGGNLLFHDAVDAADFVPTSAAGPARVVSTIGEPFARRQAAGSLAHFVRLS
jgi:predicted O-methyltransferase YrrM